MNKKERVDAALRGDQVDRIPASMWGHDFEREAGVTHGAGVRTLHRHKHAADRAAILRVAFGRLFERACQIVFVAFVRRH